MSKHRSIVSAALGVVALCLLALAGCRDSGGESDDGGPNGGGGPVVEAPNGDRSDGSGGGSGKSGDDRGNGSGDSSGDGSAEDTVEVTDDVSIPPIGAPPRPGAQSQVADCGIVGATCHDDEPTEPSDSDSPPSDDQLPTDELNTSASADPPGQ